MFLIITLNLSIDLLVFKGTVDFEDVLLLLTSFLMKNSLIIVLVIILVIVGWVLYFFRDSIRPVYDNTSTEIKEEMVDIKEDVNETMGDVKEDVSDGIEDIKK